MFCSTYICSKLETKDLINTVILPELLSAAAAGKTGRSVFEIKFEIDRAIDAAGTIGRAVNEVDSVL